MLRRGLAVIVLSGVVLGACGGGGDDTRPTLSDTKRPASTTTTTALPAYASLVAHVTVPELQVFSEPGAPAPAQSFANPWPLNDDPTLPVPLVLLVVGHQNEFLQVLLPVRPNGSTGWIRASDARLVRNDYRILVELGAHQITVFQGDGVILQEPIANGKPSTPTPPGKYYLRVLLQAPDPTTVYGPYAYGLSGHSDALTEFAGGDAELGIHGNNDASVLGQSVSSGCIRMSNEGITRLATILPLGTPVEIVA